MRASFPIDWPTWQKSRCVPHIARRDHAFDQLGAERVGGRRLPRTRRSTNGSRRSHAPCLAHGAICSQYEYPDITDRFDFTFLFGDLNFRLDLSRLHADWLISRRGTTVNFLTTSIFHSNIIF